MEAKSVTIAGQQYPVKLGHYALKKCLKRAGETKLTRLDAVLSDPDIENIPHFILAFVENGLKVESSKLKPPTIQEIEVELDGDLMFWGTVLTAVSGDIESPEKPDEGN